MWVGGQVYACIHRHMRVNENAYASSCLSTAFQFEGVSVKFFFHIKCGGNNVVMIRNINNAVDY